MRLVSRPAMARVMLVLALSLPLAALAQEVPPPTRLIIQVNPSFYSNGAQVVIEARIVHVATGEQLSDLYLTLPSNSTAEIHASLKAQAIALMEPYLDLFPYDHYRQRVRALPEQVLILNAPMGSAP